ncbi:MAG: glycosyltransferase family 2 protein [Bacteroidetes bacterium]|nr:glycosyltransferase family 2 protein [Bacteroidota bacterium]
MENPSVVSVVIPVHNGAKYLKQAVESVRCQRWPNLEILIVDDGSTDDTADVARSLGASIQLISQEQSGAAVARNRGVAEAQGKWLAFLDADDLWTESKLELQINTLQSNPSIDIVFGHVVQFICPTLSVKEKALLACPPDAVPGFHPGTMLLEKATFLNIGEFDTQWDVGEFVDWYAKAIEMGVKSTMLTDILMKRRLHNTNQGIYKRDSYSRDYLRILRASLLRRRSSTSDSSPQTQKD